MGGVIPCGVCRLVLKYKLKNTKQMNILNVHVSNISFKQIIQRFWDEMVNFPSAFWNIISISLSR